MLDNDGNIYSMGRSKFGRLGLIDEDINEEFHVPQAIKLNIPKAHSENKIIEV